jgi:hypothetical protein
MRAVKTIIEGMASILAAVAALIAFVVGDPECDVRAETRAIQARK